MERLNRTTFGWANCFRLGQVSPASGAVDTHADRHLRQCLCRKRRVRKGKSVHFPSPKLYAQYGLHRLAPMAQGRPRRRRDLDRKPGARNGQAGLDEQGRGSGATVQNEAPASRESRQKTATPLTHGRTSPSASTPCVGTGSVLLYIFGDVSINSNFGNTAWVQVSRIRCRPDLNNRPTVNVMTTSSQPRPVGSTDWLMANEIFGPTHREPELKLSENERALFRNRAQMWVRILSSARS